MPVVVCFLCFLFFVGRSDELVEELRVRLEREVPHGRIDQTDGERIRILIDEEPDVILQLAKDIKTAACDPQEKDRASGLYKGAPRLRVSAARIRVEAIGNDRVASGAQDHKR